MPGVSDSPRAAPSSQAQARRRTQAERTEATTAELLDAARERFARDGYQATSLDEIVADVGKTKGALFHHFRNKEELFAGVFEREQARLAELIAEGVSRKRSAWEALFAGCRVFLEATTDAGVQRILLLDGPSVLGWERLRRIEAQYWIAELARGIERLIAEGSLRRRPVLPLAYLLHGALCEAAMMIVQAEEPDEAMRQAVREFRRLLEGLTAPTRGAQ